MPGHSVPRLQQLYGTALKPGRCAGGAPWWRHSQLRQRCRRFVPPAGAGPFGGLFGAFGGGSSSSSGDRQQQEGQPPSHLGEVVDFETDEGGKMVALDADSSGSLDGSSEAPFGPLAVLAVGLTPQEFGRLKQLLHDDMEAEMVKVIPCPAGAMAGTLGAALEADPVPDFEQAPLGTRRVLFLSGMYAAEVMETIAAYRDAGLPQAVFAAAVRNNYSRQLQELVQEVFADHQAMKRQRQQQMAASASAPAQQRVE